MAKISITPHKIGDGGVIAMPLRANVPHPRCTAWQLTTCPICDTECWLTELARQAMAAEPELKCACTVCALRSTIDKGAQK